jgi:hypothetical protein
MWKPLTGEPCAGELHARFGGRGGPVVLLYPYQGKSRSDFVGASLRAMGGGERSTPQAINRWQANSYKGKAVLSLREPACWRFSEGNAHAF